MKLSLILTQCWELVKKSKKDIIATAFILVFIIITLDLFIKQVHIVHRLSRDYEALDKNKDLTAVLERLAKELPDSEDISELKTKLFAEAKNRHIREAHITPYPAKKGEIYNEIPMEIKGKAAYHDVAIFLNKVEKLDTLVNIKEIYLESLEPEKSSIMSLRIKASTYTVNKERQDK